jgi:phytoene dehydrogenase-like protein
MPPPINRRGFLKRLLSLGLLVLSFSGCQTPKNKLTVLKGPSQRLGHKLRDSVFLNTQPNWGQSSIKPVVIIGGGIAGLSAGWWLKKQGVEDFMLLELEPHCGGNSQFGENPVSRYPLGAHYLPIPSDSSVYVREMLEDFGVIQGTDEKKRPIYDDTMVCQAPHERLFKDGAWEEGIVPKRGITPAEDQKIKRFFETVHQLKQQNGQDGKPAFSIPLATSSLDPDFLKLDKISFQDWATQQDLRCKPLDWYLNYCCRDDYGANWEQVSAWAGLHYFASRKGEAANAEAGSILTWPEGNGWLVKKLTEQLKDHIQSDTLVYHLENTKTGIDVFYEQNTKTMAIKAEQVICALPRFIASRIIPALPKSAPAYLAHLEYAPWLVANLTLKHPPESVGAGLSWDNVSYYSKSLGYVVATHQTITQYPAKTVITYYLPLTDEPPNQARKRLHQTATEQWETQILDDLSHIHPEIRELVEHIELWPWGHGMISPGINWLWNPLRQEMQKPLGNIHFAHSDMSGVSIFEEAQYHGIQAAKRVLAKIKRAH